VRQVSQRVFWAVLVVAAIGSVVAGCGGQERAQPPAHKSSGTGGLASAPAAATAGAPPGATVFARAGCAGCHTLAAANAKGQIGPDLDQLKPSYQDVVHQVTNGGAGMPSFRGKLTATQIGDLAAFVAGSAAASKSAATAARFKPNGTTLQSCEQNDQACYQQAFGNIAYHKGPKVALALFQQRMDSNSEIEAGCHRIAHTIGGASLEYFHGSVAKAFVAGSPICWSGYYHGILERAFSGVPPTRLAQTARKLCSDPEVRRTLFIAYQCVHGLGHGLMIYTNYDLPEALRVCDELATSWDQTSCTGGVFMENQSSSYGITSRWLKANDLIYPCDIVATRDKLYCYLMVTSRILPAVGDDFRRAAAVCRRSERGWVATCFQSLGRDASGQTRANAQGILVRCATAGNMEGECIYGAARDVASQDAGATRAARLCDASPAPYRARCAEGVGTIVGTLAADTAGRRAGCQPVAAALRVDCFRGAGVPVSG
jgi:mono/diheme cytochrome c family protein